MTQEEDNDKYVVYNGLEDGAATFSLYDRSYEPERIVDRITMRPQDVPEGAEIEDHFWVDLDEDGTIIRMDFDPEFTEKKQEEAQAGVDTFRELKKQEEQQSDNDDNN